jgi:nucleoside-diphosphate-sugar epimerase
MKILVTGNLGYIGPVLGRYLKSFFASSTLVGLDSGLFSGCITSAGRIGDTYYDHQIIKDVRDLDLSDLSAVDAVVHLAAVSNDPIGNDFEFATHAINMEASCSVARLCVKAGVGRFIFASSCSMYGAAGDQPKTEADQTSPLTAYAKSKIGVETALKHQLENEDIDVTFLRFATACGASDRLRLDLVLNDFVASAYNYKSINILSNGTPWRPLIDTQDMSRAIAWALTKKISSSPLSVNIGCNEWNFSVNQLAEIVSSLIPGTKIRVNLDAPPDNRSYKVNFDLFRSLAPEFYPSKQVDESIAEIIHVISEMHLSDSGFRDSRFIRLNHLRSLLKKNLINTSLRWV